MTESKLVVRYLDGRVIKGRTLDFSSTKDSFHVTTLDQPPVSTEVRLVQVKAVFFVKDFAGNPGYDERTDYDPGQRILGRKMQVTFDDGEALVGVAEVYMPNRKGFILFPADKNSNAEKVFVVNSAVREVKFMNG
ncbi:MAG: hypothetical protein QME74_06155 [Candidatus Edwardsbacteria bacterium]|nr:hypothetical protein [Candidatus Edwardsbacteria bacterium]